MEETGGDNFSKKIIEKLNNKILGLKNDLSQEKERYNTNTKILNNEVEQLRNEMKRITKENIQLCKENKMLKEQNLKLQKNQSHIKIERRIYTEDEAIIMIQSLIRSYLEKSKYKLIKKRRNVAKEFQTTEKTYIYYINTTVVLYYNDLKKTENAKLGIAPHEINMIFGNIEILDILHKPMWKNLEKRIKDWNCFSNIADLIYDFLSDQEVISAYTEYINRYDDSIALHEKLLLSNKNWANYIDEKQENEISHGLRIESYLVAPVQRIPRYVLLLQELLKVTPPLHTDYMNVKQALEKAKMAAEKVNSSKAVSNHFKELQKINANIEFTKMTDDEEEEQILTLISNERRFITQVDCKVDGVDRMVYVFNDSIVCLAYPVSKFTSTKSSRRNSLRGKGGLGKYVFLWKAELANSYLKSSEVDNSSIFTIVENRRINIYPFSKRKTFTVQIDKTNKENSVDWWFQTWNELTRQLKIEFNGLFRSVDIASHFIANLLNENDWKILKTVSTSIKISSGDYVMCPEKKVNADSSFFLIESGSFCVERNIGNVTYIINSQLTTSQFFGEFKYLNDECFESVRATSDSYVHCFQKEKLNKILKSDPNLANRWFLLLCTIISKRFKSASKITQRATTRVEEKSEAPMSRLSINISKTPELDSKYTSLSSRKSTTMKRKTKDKSQGKDFKMCEIFNIPFNVIVKECECIYKKTNSSKLRGNIYLFRQYLCFYSKILGRKTIIVIPFVTVESMPLANKNSFMVVLKSQVNHLFELVGSEETTENIQLFISYFERTTSSKEIMGRQSNLMFGQEEKTFHLKESDWEIVFSCAKVMVFKTDEIIIKKGDYHQRLYFILKGSCRVEDVDEQSNKIKLLSTMTKEDVFGDLSFLFGGAAVANVTASEELELYCWEKKSLEQIFVKHPHLSPKFYQDMSIRISQRWMKFLDQTLKNL